MKEISAELAIFLIRIIWVLKAEGNYSLHAIMFTLPTAKDFKKNQLVKFPKSRKFTKMLKIVQNAADIFQSQQYFRFENFQHNLNFYFIGLCKPYIHIILVHNKVSSLKYTAS